MGDVAAGPYHRAGEGLRRTVEGRGALWAGVPSEALIPLSSTALNAVCGGHWGADPRSLGRA